MPTQLINSQRDVANGSFIQNLHTRVRVEVMLSCFKLGKPATENQEWGSRPMFDDLVRKSQTIAISLLLIDKPHIDNESAELLTLQSVYSRFVVLGHMDLQATRLYDRRQVATPDGIIVHN